MAGPERAGHLQLVQGSGQAVEALAFEEMLDGWRAQQLSRNFAFATIDTGARVVRRFQEHSGCYPWQWTATAFDAWMAELRRGGKAHGTLRGYRLAVRGFLAYVCDVAYGWNEVCLARFGTHPDANLQ